jgi:hypothetical protein
LQLQAQESAFVVFRRPTGEVRRDDGLNWIGPQEATRISGRWDVRFAPGPGIPGSVIQLDQLTDWSAHTNPAVRCFSGTAIYTTTFTWDATGTLNARAWLDLGVVGNLAVVTINGVGCGTAWTAPFRVEVTDALRPGPNELRIEVTNPWHNRLVQEASLAEQDRMLWMNAPNRLEGKPLLPAGLLGPVSFLVTPR